ncbi:VWA domain-containing protein [Candidatus Villigracilis affinis]|uniref:VWA domain-containing protein n=1 Tax=Candidatus Villigracilis affinis TaxID=3140682 RepID=UPI002A1C77AC|nr:VWA domain-containing protein [Anaerolineales bacterium]
MRFTSPLFLLLLLFLPITVWLGYPAAGQSRKRELTSLILRLVIVLCLILAISGLEIVQSGDNLAVVFLVDVSDSMPQQAVDAEVGYIREALQSMGVDDQAAVILFGADALVERPMSALNELAEITSVPITNQTDLAEAIQLGLAMFPSGFAKRMVILSDGAETTGNAAKAAEFAAASDVQIVVVPFVNQIDAEALVTEVDAPTHLRSGEKFDLNVSIQANQSMQATVRVFSQSEMIYEGGHDLHKGLQTLSLPLTAQDPGFVTYQVQVTPQQDAFYQNNRLDTFSQVEGPPRILVVAPPEGEVIPGGEVRPDETSLLLASLTSAGFDVKMIAPNLLPADLPTLAQYNSVVLVDVPARQLDRNQMETLQSYVRDLGGGLVAVGGPTSYGVGGYYGTPLEDALPVDMQIKDEKRRPSLTIVFIIDHSGSMSETSGGVTKLELAKEAAARSVELLFPNDHVGVIAFDDTASWVVPITDLQNPADIINAIGTIQIGGGTDIYAGLLAMSKVLPDDPSKAKHVILLTDGGADITGIPELVKKLYEENGITLSTVGVGNDAAPFLKDIAAIGGGRYHFTNNASTIATIFTEETTLATRAYIVEESFFPTLVNSSPILANITEVPQLHGYVASSAKDLAQVILESEKGDPILATWQYGLGKSVAFTSDATGRWARDWARSEIFPTFWVQAVRYTINDSLNSALQMNIETQGENASITLDARDRAGGFLNGYQVEASIVAPNGEAQTVTFTQTAPGRYESAFTPTEQGIYLIHFSGTTDSGSESASFAETTGWALSYSPEYQRIESDPDLLLRLSALANGQVASPLPADVFKHDLKATRATQPIAPLLLLIAALLLPVDIAVRRLIVTKTDLIRLREWVQQKTTLRRAQGEVPAQTSPQMEALFSAKSRVRDNVPVTRVDSSAHEVPVETDSVSRPEKEARETPSKVEESTSTTSALLARKKNIRK